MNLKTTLLLIGFLTGIFSINQAQTGDGLPENPVGNKCYVKCVTPDVYVDSTVRVMVKPAWTKLEVVPAVYKTVVETLTVKEATERYEYIPAKYRTVEETVVIEEGRNELKVLPSDFEASSEVVETDPKVGRWEMGDRAPDCESENPMDCRIVCWKEYPAKYENVPTQRKIKDETTKATPVKQRTKVVKRQVIDVPASTKKIVIPAKYETVSRQVLVSDETTKEITVPAEYTDVKIKVLQQKGGLTVWREMNCDFVDEEGALLPIYYATGSAALTNESKRIIDEKLYTMMVKEPLINIELQSHTDSRGSAESNRSLSQRRAQSVVDYLVSKGINRGRLVARGYGETRLTNGCKDGVPCSDRQHAANRRTSFRVLSR